MQTVREKISRVVETWFLTEPLFFAVWATHRLEETTLVQTIRVQRGSVQYNPGFIQGLRKLELEDVLRMEVLRILLRHPYQRRQDDAATLYQASNLTLQELLRTRLPLPHAIDVFGTHAFDRQYCEFYYHKLREQQPRSCAGACPNTGDADSASMGDGEGSGSGAEQGAGSGKAEGKAASPQSLAAYIDPDRSGVQNTEGWDKDELQSAALGEVVERIEASSSWGTIGARLRETILASLRPRMNYRDVLRLFRASILSSKRRLTRMKPNRRYGFLQLGSRHEFVTKLLFAVDVSGSMASSQLARGFSAILQFFRYGVPVIDVVLFDTEIKGPVQSLRKTRRKLEVVGRGGTDFQAAIDYIDTHREYDGLIIFTDGIAPVPKPPKNKRTRVLWLFQDEATYRAMSKNLVGIGRSTFIQGGLAED